MALHILGPGSVIRQEPQAPTPDASPPTSDELNKMGGEILARLKASLQEPIQGPPEPQRLGIPARLAGAIALGFGRDPAVKNLVLSEIQRRSPEARFARTQAVREMNLKQQQDAYNLIRQEQARQFQIKMQEKVMAFRERGLEISEEQLQMERDEMTKQREEAAQSQEGRDSLFGSIVENVPDFASTVGAVSTLLEASGDPQAAVRSSMLKGAFTQYEDFVEALQEKGTISDEDLQRLQYFRDNVNVMTAAAANPGSVKSPPPTFLAKLQEQRSGLDGVHQILGFLNEHPNIGFTLRYGNLLTEEQSQFAALLESVTSPIRKALIGAAQSEQELASIENFLPRMGMRRDRLFSGLQGALNMLQRDRRSTLETMELNGFDVANERASDMAMARGLIESRAVHPSQNLIDMGIPADATMNHQLSSGDSVIFQTPDGRVFVVSPEDMKPKEEPKKIVPKLNPASAAVPGQPRSP